MSMLRQLCDDASDTILIENNRVTLKWGPIAFNETVSLVSSQSCRSVDADAWYK